jgi:hypothetical protein
MATEISIINTALALLGEERQLTELGGATPSREERVARALLPDLRASLLRKHPWLCGEVRGTVTRVPLEGRADWKFKNVFLLPADFLRLWGVEAFTWARDAYQVGPWTVYDGDGRVVERRKALFSNHDGPIDIGFIAEIAFEHLDPCLASVMSKELGGLMAGPLQADKALTRSLAERAREELAYAVTVETSEFQGGDPTSGPGRFLAAR